MSELEAEPIPEGLPSEPERTAFLEGSFAMFATPTGDVILVTNTNLMGEQITRVPRFVVRQAARSNPAIREILENAAA
jgi:hypothetical protein